MDKEKFTDDIGKKRNKVIENENLSGPTSNDLQEKWNQIQEEYLAKYPDLDIDDLYFEGGGFNGLLEKISLETGRSIEEIKNEIEEW